MLHSIVAFSVIIAFSKMTVFVARSLDIELQGEKRIWLLHAKITDMNVSCIEDPSYCKIHS